MRRAALTALALALIATGTSSALAAPARSARPTVPVTQPLVILLQDHVAHAAASQRARVIEPVAALRPLTQVRTVLPVMGFVKGKDGNRWVHVRLPGRPSGHTGWILADQTIRSSTEWRIVVKVSARTVTVYRDGLVVRAFPAVVPKPSTPTPYGQFFVEEGLKISKPGSAARSRWPSAPAPTSSRSSRAAPARSRSTARTVSRIRSGARPRTAASGSARAPSRGSPAASAAASR